MKTIRYILFVFTILEFVFLSSTNLKAQNSNTSLELGKSIERELSDKQIHTYTIFLTSNDYLDLVVEQRGIDVIVTALSPNGKTIAEVDSPNGTDGHEEVYFIADITGIYSFQVKALEKNSVGRYSINLKSKRVATQEDNKQINNLKELEEIETLETQAAILSRQNKYSEAILLVEKILAVREKVLGKDHESVVRTILALGYLYSENAEYSRAEALYKRSLEIDEKVYGKDHPNLAIAYGNLGTLFYQLRDFEQSEIYLLKALKLREKEFGNEHPDVALSIYNLSKLYEAKGDLIRAEQFGEKALAIYKKIRPENHPDIGRSLNQLAESYRLRGDYKRAESLYGQAITIFKNWGGEKNFSLTTPMSDLALLYHTTGNFKKSEELYKEVLKIYDSVLGKEHPLIANLLNNLAGVYVSENDYNQAEILQLQALSIRKKIFGENSPETANSLNNLASIYQHQRRYKEAEKNLQKVLAVWEKSLGANHPDIATVCSNLAILYSGINDIPNAVKYSQRMSEVEEYNLKLILNIGSEKQKQSYLNKLSANSDFIVSLNVNYAEDNAEATKLAVTNILQRKGRSLDVMIDQIGNLRQRANSQDREILGKIVAARSKLANLVISNLSKLSLESKTAEISKIEQELENLEDSIGKRSIKFQREFESVSLEAVQKALPNDVVLLEFISFRRFDLTSKKISGEQYAVYVIDGKSLTPKVINLGNAEIINNEILEWRKALSNPNSLNVKTIARSLDEKLMRPIRKLIGSTGRVFISPDGILNLIPFAALVDEKGKYFVENYSSSYLTSGRDLLHFQNTAENKNASVIFANPFYNSTQNNNLENKTNENIRSIDFTKFNFPSLPGTAVEAEQIGSLLPGAKIFTEEMATEDALKKVNAPFILHIATHGFFLPVREAESLENPLLRSGLVLAGVNKMNSGGEEDGVLTAMETAGLNLWGTKLVVLSACETGLGDIHNWEGVYGLRRALISAGSETQVVSLWKVSDNATSDLMRNYYSLLLNKAGRTDALRQVQLNMINKKVKNSRNDNSRGSEIFTTNDEKLNFSFKFNSKIPFAHPYYWASFIQSGAWDDIKINQ